MVILLMLIFAASVKAESRPVEDQKLFAVDEQQWVLFYDLPSRRFRQVRDNFIRREFESAARNLKVGSSHIRVEAQRASSDLSGKLVMVADQLEQLAQSLKNIDVTVASLDPLFARTYWLLSQHYLEQATANRDRGKHEFAGHYLISTNERCVSDLARLKFLCFDLAVAELHIG